MVGSILGIISAQEERVMESWTATRHDEGGLCPIIISGVATVGAFPTVGFCHDDRPTVNSNGELTVATVEICTPPDGGRPDVGVPGDQSGVWNGESAAGSPSLASLVNEPVSDRRAPKRRKKGQILGETKPICGLE